MHLQVKQDLNQVSTILICVKNTGIIPCFRVSMKGTIANCLTDSSFCFNQGVISSTEAGKKRWNLLLKASIVEELKWKQTNLVFEIFWYLWVPRKKSRSVGLLCVSGWGG